MKHSPIKDASGWQVIAFASIVVVMSWWSGSIRQQGKVDKATHDLEMCEFKRSLMVITMQELIDQLPDEARVGIPGAHAEGPKICATLGTLVELGVAKWRDPEPWTEIADCSSYMGCTTVTLAQLRELQKQRGLVE